MKILLTGAKGQLGTDIRERLSAEHEITGVDIDELDIGEIDAVMGVVRGVRPDVIINAAAYTNVDGCESDADSAYRANALGVRNLAVGALETGARLMHISTDFVFDGIGRRVPYNEFDAPNPQSVYGKTKLAGEGLLKEICGRHYIIRTAWLYGHHGNNFVKTMLRLAESREKLQVVDDQVGTPTYTQDLVSVIALLMHTDAYGLYHCSNEGQCSWNAFARKIFELAGKAVEVEGITTAQLGRPASRPAYSVMDKLMLRVGFGYVMRDWEMGLEAYFSVAPLLSI